LLRSSRLSVENRKNTENKPTTRVRKKQGVRRYDVEGEGGEWVIGLGDWYLYEIGLWMHAGNLLRHKFRNRLKCHLLPSNRYGFRNRLKCHLLQSIILSLSLIGVNVIDYHFHLFTVNETPVMGLP
jgi:hypothetical protein